MHILRNIAYYFLFWMLFFSSDRLFSLLYQFSKSKQLSVADLLGSFVYGWRMDASASAYLVAIPFLLLLFSYLGASRLLKSVVLLYTYTVLLGVVVLCVTDRGIFQHWGFRLDATPLQFLDSPHEMLASLTNFELISAFVGGLLLWLFWCFVAHRFIRRFSFLDLISLRKKIMYSVLYVLLSPILFLLMRGGWQQLPMNASLVYFTDNQYANQTAVNPVWNFFFTVAHREAYQKENPFTYFPLAEAETLAAPLMPLPIDSADFSILNTPHPNVLIIIWESLTAKVFEPLGGEANVTPNLAAIAKEGLLFTNIYANGNRSDKGLPAIGSAYPAQPAQSIMLLNGKMQRLPHLSHGFNANGYRSSFYYGGDLNFGNMYAYYNRGAYAPIVGRSDFADKDMNKKWGASDGAVIRRFLDDTPSESEHFFKVLFTLSSHEPFDVPMKAHFEGDDINTKFKNAHAYTDSCVGALIREAKTKKWWNNTLIVILADHGHQLPDYQDSGYEKAKTFHIPMLFTGGALAKKGKITTFGNQSDLAATLYHQLGWSSQNFKFSRDLFCAKQPHFAHYIFNDGFGFVDEQNTIIYKHDYDAFMEDKSLTPKAKERAKAYLQMTYQDFIEK
jgi:phosphoglycerol transferase MdoB-like AlkP superfamily enzyme